MYRSWPVISPACTVPTDRLLVYSSQTDIAIAGMHWPPRIPIWRHFRRLQPGIYSRWWWCGGMLPGSVSCSPLKRCTGKMAAWWRVGVWRGGGGGTHTARALVWGTGDRGRPGGLSPGSQGHIVYRSMQVHIRWRAHTNTHIKHTLTPGDYQIIRLLIHFNPKPLIQ